MNNDIKKFLLDKKDILMISSSEETLNTKNNLYFILNADSYIEEKKYKNIDFLVCQDVESGKKKYINFDYINLKKIINLCSIKESENILIECLIEDDGYVHTFLVDFSKNKIFELLNSNNLPIDKSIIVNEKIFLLNYIDNQIELTECKNCFIDLDNGFEIKEGSFELTFSKKEEDLDEIEKDKKQSAENKDGPNMITMAKSFGSSMVKWAQSGFKLLKDEEIFNKRLDICKACPNWDPKAFNNTGKCKICGCSTLAKLKLPTEKCPLDYWGPVDK